MTDAELEAIRDRMASHSFASELYADRAALLAEVDRLKGAVQEERQRCLRIVATNGFDLQVGVIDSVHRLKDEITRKIREGT